MEKEKILIVIGRQFGSGGKRIGQLVADRLGVSYYDKELMTEAAQTFGFSPEIFARTDEKRPSPFRSVLHLVLGAPQASSDPDTLSPENIYGAQSRVIKGLCSHESCVIVGRSADYVMRDHPHLLSVFLHAPEHIRTARILRRGEVRTEDEAIELARKRDTEREGYYNYYTGRRWGVSSNYNLSIDTSMMSDEESAELIADVALRKFGLEPDAYQKKK